MKHLIIYLLTIFVGLFLYLNYRKDSSSQSAPTLNIFASSSFVSKWGPGPFLEKEFEEICQCQIEWKEMSDGYLVIQKIKSGDYLDPVDMVLSFDRDDVEHALKNTEWMTFEEISEESFDDRIQFMGNRQFVPYNWSALAFVGKSTLTSSRPTSLEELAEDKWKDQFVLIDPRSSGLGLLFLRWIFTAYGPNQGNMLLKKINKQAKLYAPSWSQAYGLFRDGQVAMVLSFVTSPLYHIVEENHRSIEAYAFKEGHPIYVEFFGIPKTAKNPQIAKEFAMFLLSEKGQKILMEKNYMLPVRSSLVSDTPFQQSLSYEFILPDSGWNRDQLLDWWAKTRF